MNREKIIKIVTSDNPYWEHLLLIELAKDKETIPTMLTILENERNYNRELISDMNVLLSKADTIIETPKLNKDNFVQKEIDQFYKKYKGAVSHCFQKVNSSNEADKQNKKE